MYTRASGLVAVVLLAVSPTLAKDKTKPTLPPYVLTARTVAVVVDPDAGMSVDNPQANQIAQKDVETALLNWGRFDPTISTQAADLIIVVRKGHGRMLDETIPDPRQNSRAGVINPTDNGISIGAQHGSQSNPSNSSTSNFPASQSPTQTEIGAVDDSFVVYKGGGVGNPLDSPPAWRYVAKDGLRPHNVPAVDAFRKAVAEAEKAAAKKP